MNHHKIIIFDFETDGTDPNVCNPVQLAALVVDPYTLDIMPKEEFCITIRPRDLEIDEVKYIEDHKSTIDWHAKNYKCTADEIIAMWKGGSGTKYAWEKFAEFVNKWNPKKTKFTAPMAGGANIRKFDLIIADRLNKQYNISDLFWPRDVVDVLDLAFYWFEGLAEPTSYSMDSLRPFFGISSEGGHDAMKDVIDSAAIITRFMKMTRTIAKTKNFKGAFAKAKKSKTIKKKKIG